MQTARDVFNELRHIRRADTVRPASSAEGSRSCDGRQSLDRGAAVHRARGRCGRRRDGVGADRRHHREPRQVSRTVGGRAQSTRAFKDSPLDVRQIAERDRRALHRQRQRAASRARHCASRAQVIDAQQRRAAVEREPTIAARQRRSVRDPGRPDRSHRGDRRGQSGVLARSMVQLGEPDGDRSATSTPTAAAGADVGIQHRAAAPARHARLRDAIEARARATIRTTREACGPSSPTSVSSNTRLWFNPRPDPLGRAQRAARRAIEIDRGNQSGWLWLALTHFHLHDRARLRRSAASGRSRINPRNAYAHGVDGQHAARTWASTNAAAR